MGGYLTSVWSQEQIEAIAQALVPITSANGVTTVTTFSGDTGLALNASGNIILDAEQITAPVDNSLEIGSTGLGGADLFSAGVTGSDNSGPVGLGSGNTESGDTGDVQIYTGSSTSGNTGNLTLEVGFAGGSTRGNLIINAPNIVGVGLQGLSFITVDNASGDTHSIDTTTGSATGLSGNSAESSTGSGDSAHGNTGDVTLYTGTATNGTGGDVRLIPGAGSDAAHNGNIFLQTGNQLQIVLVSGANVVFTGLPTSSAGLPSGALWNSSGTLKVV